MYRFLERVLQTRDEVVGTSPTIRGDHTLQIDQCSMLATCQGAVLAAQPSHTNEYHQE